MFEVLSTSGDTHLGGDDFDRRIVDFLADDFQRNEQIDLRKDRQALQRLTEAAEKAKMELSTLSQVRPVVSCRIPALTSISLQAKAQRACRSEKGAILSCFVMLCHASDQMQGHGHLVLSLCWGLGLGASA